MNALETLDTKHVAIQSDTKGGMRIRGEKGTWDMAPAPDSESQQLKEKDQQAFVPM